MATATTSATGATQRNPAAYLRTYLFFEGFVRLLLWQSSMAITVAAFNRLGLWPTESPFGGEWPVVWLWVEKLAHAIVLFNVVYLIHLLVLRALLPSPKEGRYEFGGGKFEPQIIWGAFISILLRARYSPPFPGFLVFHLCNLPPLCWLANLIFGPKSGSCLVLDPLIPDPGLTEIGRNVVIGNMTSIICHTQYRDSVDLRKTVLEDDVMIGAHALVYSGCRIKRGAVVYGGAVVPPNTVIGENEAWGGVPARKIKDLPPLEG